MPAIATVEDRANDDHREKATAATGAKPRAISRLLGQNRLLNAM